MNISWYSKINYRKGIAFFIKSSLTYIPTTHWTRFLAKENRPYRIYKKNWIEPWYRSEELIREMLPDRLRTVAWPVLDRNDPLDDRWQERKIRQKEIDLPSQTIPSFKIRSRGFYSNRTPIALLLLPSSSSSFYSRLKKSFNSFHSRHWFYWKLSHNWNWMN